MPEEVSHQSDVELFWVKEFLLVIVNILLLDGAIKEPVARIVISSFQDDQKPLLTL